MSLELNVQMLAVLFTAIITGCFAFVIFIGSKNLSSRFFVVFLVIIAIWMISVGFRQSASNVEVSTLVNRLSYSLGATIAVVFFLFAKTFPEDYFPSFKMWIITGILLGVLIYLISFTSLMIGNAVYVNGFWGWEFGPLWFLFDIFFNGFFLAGIIVIYKKYRVLLPSIQKTNLRYMFWSMFIGVIPPIIVNIVLPEFNIFNFEWLGPVSGLFWIASVTYSIIKYRQMNVKAIAAEFLISIMVALLFINIFMSEPIFGTIGKLFIFLVFIIIGILAIRSIVRESLQKDQLEDLSNNLQKKVNEQTEEIQKAYRVEKQARLELEVLNKAKDQFILTAQHHLRTPLTIFKGFVQTVLDDRSVSLPDMSKQRLKKALTAADRMNALVNEFLDIAQLEVGETVLKMRPLRLETIIREIYDSLISEAEKKNLQVTVEFSEAASNAEVNADQQKLKMALFNLIDNAIKYTIRGNVTIQAEVIVHPIERTRFMRVRIKDTGIGIKKEDISTIFSRYFQRGETAEKIYRTGRGLGLVLSKNIIEAHGGRLTAESAGENQGATFIVELPLK